MRSNQQLVALAAALLAAGGSVVSTQTTQRPQATFRAEINYVEVDVLVTDAQGNFVTGLKAGDFEVIDAGKPQTIDTLREINVPIVRYDGPLTSATPVYSDVASNEAAAEGRIFVFVLDDFHTWPARTNLVKQLARNFITTQMGSNDLAAIVQTSGRRDSAQDFTSNKGLLLAAVDRFMGQGLEGAVMARMRDQQNRMNRPNESAPAVDRDARERLMRGRVLFDTIRGLSADLAAITGRRKAMLLFSEGVDLQSVAMQGGIPLDDTRRAMQNAIAEATRANVHVYGIDATGMSVGGLVSSETQSILINDLAAGQGLTTGEMAEERRRSTDTLRSLASETGGGTVLETNDFREGFARIQRENSTYYVLGFAPQDRPDGTFHPLDVRVKRPGVQVRARAGYHAAKSGTRPAANLPMVDLMTAALPVEGLPMHVAAPVFAGKGDESTVVITIDLPHDVLRFEQSGELFTEDFHAVFQAVGDKGKAVAGDGHELALRLRPDAKQIVDDRGLRFVARLKLKPGRYQLRVAAEAKNAGRRGSVFTDVIVPDFADERLVWSGISLNSAEAEKVPTRPADSETEALLPLLPSAVRSFTTNDTLALYGEVYGKEARGSNAVDLIVAIRDDVGKVVHTTTEERTTPNLEDGRTGFGLGVEVPLRRFPRGNYVLSLTARSRASGNATATREIPFSVSGVAAR